MEVSFHEPLLLNQEVEAVSKDASMRIKFKYKWFKSYIRVTFLLYKAESRGIVYGIYYPLYGE